MDGIVILVILALVFALIVVPIWILLKLTRIEDRLLILEVNLHREQQPLPARTEVLRAPSGGSAPEVQSAPASQTQPAISLAPLPKVSSKEPVASPEKSWHERALENLEKTKEPPKKGVFETAVENLEARTRGVLRKIWSFLVVGEEYRRPDVPYEYAVATTWLIRLGVLVLLCGIGFFLKYAVEHSWLKPGLRVLLMVLCGVSMAVVGSWKSTGKYGALMIALSGMGFVTLYLSIMAAYRLYHLMGPLPAFAAMGVVTFAAMATALGMNELLPAILGCIGGFLAPCFIETGSHHLTYLFIYMTILAAGTLFTAYYRSWVLLHLSSFLCYAVLGGTAIAKYMNGPFAGSLLVLLSINFALYSWVVLGTALRRDATLLELLLLFANATFYFYAAIPIAQQYYGAYKIAALLPLWTAGLGGGQMGYAVRRIAEKRPSYRMFLTALIAFSLALDVPLLLGGVWVMTAWAVLAFLMLAMGIRSHSRTLLVMSLLLYIITQVMLLLPGPFVSTDSTYMIALLHRLLGPGVMTLAWAAAAVLIFYTNDLQWCWPCSRGNVSPWQEWSMLGFAVMAGFCFLCYTSREWSLCMREYWPCFSEGVLVLWWSLLILACLAISHKCSNRCFFMPILVILGVLSLIWLVKISEASSAWRVDGSLEALRALYWRHLLTVLLTRGVYVVSLTVAGIELFRQRAPKGIVVTVLSLAGFLFFLYTSQEIHTMLRVFLYGFHNGGVSIWWSLCAIALLFSGIRWRMKTLRILGVLLFAVCTGKVFVVDLARLAPIWRITAFGAIGLVMLLGAVMCIRYKELFSDNVKDTIS